MEQLSEPTLKFIGLTLDNVKKDNPDTKTVFTEILPIETIEKKK